MARPEWIAYSNEEIEEFIVKFKREGKTASQIGVIYPEDLMNLIRRAVNIRDHLEENPKDLHGKRGLTIIESRIRRLGRYYAKNGQLPEGWRYDPTKAALLVK